MREHNLHTLANGLRIIHESSPTEVLYCGYTVDAGTRDEDLNEQGMAHFCEHMAFKGTERRKSWHILNGLERVGGDLNAYTNKEETVYYAAVLKEDFTRAADLLTDIVFHSIYPQKEIDKEIEVIIDEIESYKDSPSEQIFDDFENILFCGHSLGRSILGTPEHLRSFRTEDALRFVKRLYCPSNVTFFVYGKIDFSKIIHTIEKLTADIPSGSPIKNSLQLPEYRPQIHKINLQTHQAHVMIGNRCYSAYDKKRVGLFLLNNLLGGPGMNSRLNLSLRERHGLVYTVESNLSSYTDTGVWNIYFGCDNKDIDLCRELVSIELRRMTEEPLTKTQLSAAKKQLKGQIGISCDNFENYALSMGKIYTHYNHYRDIDKLYEQIEALTSEQLLEIAQEIFDENQLSTLLYENKA